MFGGSLFSIKVYCLKHLKAFGITVKCTRSLKPGTLPFFNPGTWHIENNKLIN